MVVHKPQMVLNANIMLKRLTGKAESNWVLLALAMGLESLEHYGPGW
jgi:hypothetical protein